MRQVLVVFCFLIVIAMLAPTYASAYTLTEDFEDTPFGIWEWENNSDGLWIHDGSDGSGGESYITFIEPYISTTSFTTEIASHSHGLTIDIPDSSSSIMYTSEIWPTGGTGSDPWSYENHTVNSLTGIDRFPIQGGSDEEVDRFPIQGGSDEEVDIFHIQGGPDEEVDIFPIQGGPDEWDEGIDNNNVVPEPTTIALLGIGLIGLAGAEVRRRRKNKAVNKS